MGGGGFGCGRNSFRACRCWLLSICRRKIQLWMALICPTSLFLFLLLQPSFMILPLFFLAPCTPTSFSSHAPLTAKNSSVFPHPSYSHAPNLSSHAPSQHLFFFPPTGTQFCKSPHPQHLQSNRQQWPKTILPRRRIQQRQQWRLSKFLSRTSRLATNPWWTAQ